jgi:hypothetical protein
MRYGTVGRGTGCSIAGCTVVRLVRDHRVIFPANAEAGANDRGVGTASEEARGN